MVPLRWGVLLMLDSRDPVNGCDGAPALVQNWSDE